MTTKLEKIKTKVLLFQPSNKTIILISWVWALLGILALFLLTSDPALKGIYVDENALLINSGWVYYSSDQVDLAEKYQQDLTAIKDSDSQLKSKYIVEQFNDFGFLTYTQSYDLPNKQYQKPISGINTYAVLKAPRGDGTEALVLSADWNSSIENGKDNIYGIALLLSLAQQFSTSNFWAKDIIFLITDNGLTASQVWLNAYYTSNTIEGAENLAIIGSEIQMAVSLDFPNNSEGYDSLSFYYALLNDKLLDGPNGQLPNMDLVSTIAEICDDFQITHYMYEPPRKELSENNNRLITMLTQLKYMAFCLPSSYHGLFLNYGVSTVTIKGNQGINKDIYFKNLGWIIESMFRSLNNLLERLHHSTHFYIYVNAFRYIPLTHYIIVVLVLALLPILIVVLKLRKSETDNQRNLGESNKQIKEKKERSKEVNEKEEKKEKKEKEEEDEKEKGEKEKSKKELNEFTYQQNLNQFEDELIIPKIYFYGGYKGLLLFISSLSLTLLCYILITRPILSFLIVSDIVLNVIINIY
ncbi:Gaa1-domain-containing protein [Neoconidiobolus thromboides FSU 785]|nr:Gaa1-domain-containing protein [Neoconidiobolus thromboides FSU 785]